MTSAGFEARLRDRAARMVARAVAAAAARRAGRLAAAALPGVTVVDASGTPGTAAILMAGRRLRHRYVRDAALRRLIREQL